MCPSALCFKLPEIGRPSWNSIRPDMLVISVLCQCGLCYERKRSFAEGIVRIDYHDLIFSPFP